MHQVLADIFRTGASETPNGGTVKVHSHVLMTEGHLLQSLVRELRPSVTLEVGLAYGVAALFICETLREVGGQCHIVIDPAQNEPTSGQPWLGVGLYNLKRAGFESLIEFYAEPSFRVLPRLEAQGRVIDFAFVDGWTTFDFKLVDFFFIDRLLKVGGVVAMRAGDMPAGRKLYRYIATNLAYRVCGVFPARRESLLWRRRLWKRVLKSDRIRSSLQRLLRPEILIPDDELSLSTCLVAFRKEHEDNRKWNFHRQF
jgi:hypothetical protein